MKWRLGMLMGAAVVAGCGGDAPGGKPRPAKEAASGVPVMTGNEQKENAAYKDAMKAGKGAGAKTPAKTPEKDDKDGK